MRLDLHLRPTLLRPASAKSTFLQLRDSVDCWNSAILVMRCWEGCGTQLQIEPYRSCVPLLCGVLDCA